MDSANPQAPSMPIAAGLGLKIYRYKGLIRRHWWILALTIGLGLAYQAYVLFNKPQLFESSSQLLIREDFIPEGGRTGTTFQDPYGNIFGTAVEQLKSDIILNRAKNKLSLEAPQLNGRVDITSSSVPRTNIFVVKGVGSSPEYTQRFVDSVVAEFLLWRREQRDTTLTQFTTVLTDQANVLRGQLKVQQAAFQKFIQDNNMEFWTEQGKSAAQFLSGLKNQEAQLRNDLQRLQNLSPDDLLQLPMSQAQAQVPAGAGGGKGGAGITVQTKDAGAEIYSQFLRTKQELAQAQAEVAQWKTVWKPKHPKMQALEARVEKLERLLEVIRGQTGEASKARIVAINAELKGLEVTIKGWEAKVAEASKKDAEYQQLQAEVNNTQRELDRIVGNTQNVGGGKNAAPDAFVISQKATAPAAVPPGTVKHLLIGLIGGFVVGMVVLLILDRADDRLSSSTEMLDHFSEPILGQIPNVADTRKDTGLPLLQPEDERYTYAEAFRSLRSSLIFMPNQAELKTILVTSAIPNEGKSTIASNLAVTMAASGARVLLVDADLRRGDIAQLFDIDGRIGLSDILRGGVHWKEATQSCKMPTLTIIPRGPVTNQSGELLLKPMLMSLLDEFKDTYDLTIFNTAPILAADDTPTLAPNFDGVLMVIRASFTSARLTKQSLNMLYQRQVNVLGLILNCIDTEMPDYYYYQYPKYYAAQ